MEMWKVKEYYKGVFDNEKALCICNDIMSAATIIDAMCLLHKGRPFWYQAKYIGTNWEIDKELLKFKNPITDEIQDYTKYVFEEITSL